MMRTPASQGGVFSPPAPGGPADADLFKAPGPSAPAAKGGPSFTQVMAARPAGAPAPGQAASGPTAPEETKKGPPYLILALVVGLLIVLVVVLVLLLRH